MNVPPLRLEPTTRQSFPPSGQAPDGLERRGEPEKSFTSPQVAGFIGGLLEATHGTRFLRSTRLIDPPCGEAVSPRLAHERGGLVPERSILSMAISIYRRHAKEIAKIPAS